MKRTEMVQAVKATDRWDMIIIGGGATGLGVAVDAASRGYKTLLLEKDDFAKGTSSRSTKLVHGGVRYLEQGNISLVFEALKERGLLKKNAPHLVHDQSFLVPFYSRWRGSYYWLGLKIYDLMAGNLGLGSSKYLTLEKTLDRVPTLKKEKLRGGILYFDGQFDDSRLAINLAQTSAEQGGTLINYMKVTGLMKSGGKVYGVQVQDMLNGDEYEIEGETVVNATGVFTDSIRKMDNPEASPIITPSQGIHIVIDKHFLPGDTAIMIPKTSDGRILFALPWYDKVMVGTTDTPVEEIKSEPEALENEIDFILEHTAKYLTDAPTKSDIKSIFAGLRPLVTDPDAEDTAEVSRDHSLLISKSGLMTIAGGKWTTYREMAEDVVDKAIEKGGLSEQECITENLKIHGWKQGDNPDSPLSYYGSDKENVEQLVAEDPELGERLHSQMPYIKAEVVWATRNEMAMTVEDFNARRTRALLLDAEASLEMAPEVARLMAREAGYDDQWIEKQLEDYKKLVEIYQPK
ncbi:FAD-dependent oxidoreductase [Aliifodinibius salicampi]|uniref:FAD-dependent oxidoreductase n=1 Tax=Fodinibius salicampi TaxID=1920655 RepID=A0ABT3Q1K1_9BACT|nr:FAD-dependent oxidoreductase [Fodinibius salicampi]MCW9713994.1 FAD-dependent oxidoreductase [Fodinibius salicampi]